MTAKPCESHEVMVDAGGVPLLGNLCVPPNASGMVVFVHGSGSSRLSSRNQYVASQLNEAGFATLLFDLLTAEEGRVDQYTGQLRFDIDLLSKRLGHTLGWLRKQAQVPALPIGLFGASTGAAAALVAAAEHPETVRAVVSRGGRPDLAGGALMRVRSPTLLIVGGNDEQVIALNRTAERALLAEHRLEIVAGATHLFEEPGTLETVSELAADWFARQLREAHGADRIAQ